MMQSARGQHRVRRETLAPVRRPVEHGARAAHRRRHRARGQAIGCEVTAPSDLAPRDKLGELLKFAVSGLVYGSTRRIGVAVQS